jgi:hypothetical protein
VADIVADLPGSKADQVDDLLSALAALGLAERLGPFGPMPSFVT